MCEALPPTLFRALAGPGHKPNEGKRDHRARMVQAISLAGARGGARARARGRGQAGPGRARSRTPTRLTPGRVGGYPYPNISKGPAPGPGRAGRPRRRLVFCISW